MSSIKKLTYAENAKEQKYVRKGIQHRGKVPQIPIKGTMAERIRLPSLYCKECVFERLSPKEPR